MAKEIDPACTVCGARPALKAKFMKVQGLVLMHRTTYTKGFRCQECAVKVHDEFKADMLSKGWWSLGGAMGTPIFLLGNSLRLKKFRALPTPVRPGQAADVAQPVMPTYNH